MGPRTGDYIYLLSIWWFVPATISAAIAYIVQQCNENEESPLRGGRRKFQSAEAIGVDKGARPWNSQEVN
jgi:hypothetical protein